MVRLRTLLVRSSRVALKLVSQILIKAGFGFVPDANDNQILFGLKGSSKCRR